MGASASLAFVCLALASGNEEDREGARTILDRVAEAYAGCETYQDEGVVSTLFVTDRGNWSDVKPFRTAFIRPDRFRFEFESKGFGPPTRYIVWQRGESVKTWWSIDPGVESPESLAMGLAGATGVSGGSAHAVPTLLMPDHMRGFRLTNLRDAERIDDAELDGRVMVRVQGSQLDSTILIWIDPQQWLIRRIDQDTPVQDFKTTTTTTYEPVIDEEVADERLAFGIDETE